MRNAAMVFLFLLLILVLPVELLLVDEGHQNDLWQNQKCFKLFSLLLMPNN